ncbi:SAICAR synthase-like protein [Mycena sp. CBHHK59/15]|nr:SAICAR synthase-like protein [Mycena sp. CBHHK59/15]
MAQNYNSGSATRALASQVGGHSNGVLTTEDDTLLIKQALPLELQFYQTVTAASSPELDALRPFIPRFLGTLSLEGELDIDKPPSEISINVKPVEGPKKESLVLENLAHPFLKPNILDIKLGTVLYDESAPPDKVERMLNVAKNTTSLETGIRLTGFQVYDNIAGQPVNTPKSYGKSIKVEQLPEGIARFFPIAPGVEGPAPAVSQGLPAPILLQILELLREDVQDIREAFAAIEMRMVGGSLLIVYESDLSRAQEGLEWMLNDDSEEEEDDGNDDEDEDSSKSRPGPPCDVRLIDFAHTRFVPGQGPDKGVLRGLDTVLALLDERIASVSV